MPVKKKRPAARPKARKPAARTKSRRKSGGKKGRGIIFSLVFALIVIVFIGIWIFEPMMYLRGYDYVMRYYRYTTMPENKTFESTSPQPVIRTQENYGEEIDRLAAKFDLNPEFLKSLIVLECSGLKKIKPRFEKHIYRKLVALRAGKLDKFENLRPNDVHDATDDALENMASSWGPFQIMGYKCVWLDIQLADLRGEEALYWAVKWVDLTYGDYIRRGQYKDAFHIHNTGQPYPDSGPPRTYDRNYVPNGMMYMKYFKDLREKPPEIKSADPV